MTMQRGAMCCGCLWLYGSDGGARFVVLCKVQWLGVMLYKGAMILTAWWLLWQCTVLLTSCCDMVDGSVAVVFDSSAMVCSYGSSSNRCLHLIL